MSRTKSVDADAAPRAHWQERFDDERFQSLLADCPEATFYHTRTWARILTTAFPQLEDRSGILLIDQQPCAVPIFRWRRLGGLLCTLHTSFPYLYGGPIPSSPRPWEALLARLSETRESSVLIGNPFARKARAPGTPLRVPSALQPKAETTHLLTLPGSVEEYWSRVLTSRKRNDIRRLTRKGVTIELSREDADIRSVYGLYLKTMATWKQRPRLVYPPALYQAMIAQGGESVRLYIARFEGRLIGGTFVCRWNGIAHYHAGYFDHGARSLRPNVLVQERIIRDAIEDGFRIYDMLPSAELANVEAFKESLGGVRTSFDCWERPGRLHRLIGRIRGAGRW